MEFILIGGKWRETSENFEVRSPYSGEMLEQVCSANAAEAEEAIYAAEVASREMRKLSRSQISDGLRSISNGIRNRRDEFANTITLESGKPITAALGEVDRAVATFALAASEAERFAGEMIPLDVQKGG